MRLKAFMRNSKDICLLCMKNSADKKNSHIIPKFLGKGLFEGTSPRHALQIGKKKSKRKIQDTLKEDHIFCSNCEDKFNTLETYISLRLNKVGNNRYYNDFKVFKRGDFKYYESLTIHPEISQLFWYSVLWRISVSNHEAFLSFKLNKDIECELRRTLIQNTYSYQNDLINHLDNNNICFKYPFVLIRPQKFLRPPGSLMAATNMSAGVYWTNLVDYLLIFYESFDLVDDSHLEIANLGANTFRIGVSANQGWINFNKILLQKVGKAHFE